MQMLFEEKQKVPVFLVWIAGFTSLALCFPLLWGLYTRIILQEPWGEASMSNQNLMLLLLFVVAVEIFVIWLITRITLEVRIDRSGIEYRYLPNHSKIKHIGKELIETYEVRALKWNEILESKRTRKLGQRGKDYYFRIGGKIALVLKDHNGQQYYFGTKDPEGLSWAMRKLMSTPS